MLHSNKPGMTSDLLTLTSVPPPGPATPFISPFRALRCERVDTFRWANKTQMRNLSYMLRWKLLPVVVTTLLKHEIFKLATTKPAYKKRTFGIRWNDTKKEAEYLGVYKVFPSVRSVLIC